MSGPDRRIEEVPVAARAMPTQRPVAMFGVARIEPLNQHETESIMLIQDQLPETDETATDAVAGDRTSKARHVSERSDQGRRTRGHRRLLAAFAVTVALVGIASVAVRDRGGESTPSSGAGTGEVSDGSFEVAEANRMATLRDLSVGEVSDGSFEVAEANRMATLRDLMP
jgi:hypothetical protein